jgi:hypothetical protein
VRLNQQVIEYLGEDRIRARVSQDLARRPCDVLQHVLKHARRRLDRLWVENDGTIVGCNSLSAKQINDIESCHLTALPSAKPEYKSFPL